MIVYSNSCSFGAPALEHKVYADHVASAYNAKLINRGIPGSCNRKIIRNSLRDLLEIADPSGVIALIGLTFISRTELWQPWISPVDNDGHFFPIRIASNQVDWSTHGLIDHPVTDGHRFAEARVADYYKNWLLHYHPESALTDLLTDVIMFCGWADNNNIQYQIFSNVDVFPSDNKVGYTSPFIRSLRQSVLDNKNIINPWDFSFGTYALAQGFVPKDYYLYNKHGHPGGEAHKLFGDFLLERLK